MKKNILDFIVIKKTIISNSKKNEIFNQLPDKKIVSFGSTPLKYKRKSVDKSFRITLYSKIGVRKKA